MDKELKYKKLIKEVLSRHLKSSNKQPSPELEEMLIADDENGIYIWQTLGWGKKERHNYQHVFARVKNQKIYLEEDWTEDGIAAELINEGVPKSDIVLAFHSPKMRELTEFAVA